MALRGLAGEYEFCRARDYQKAGMIDAVAKKVPDDL